MGQKEPSPGQSECNERHPGYRTPTYPVRPKSGSRERWNGSYGNAFRMFPLAPVGRGPSGCILPRVSLHFVSLCPGLGSSCPFGAFTSNRILMRMFFHDNKDNTIGALTANSIPVRNWKSVKKRRKKPWKSVICRSLCPVYKQNIAIYIITRTITDVHGRHGELLYDSSCVSYFR